MKPTKTKALSRNSRAECIMGGDNLPELESQKKLIHETDWDVLIILDACRYDYFEEEYEDYLKGNLKKVESPGSWTVEWLKEIFNDFWEVVYVSGNPFINTYGIERDDFEPTKVFDKIINVWEGGWKEDFNVLPPGKVGRKVRIARAKYPQSPIIGHFLQPHGPYLDLAEEGEGNPRTKDFGDTEKGIRRTFANLFIKLFGYPRFRTFRRIMVVLGKARKSPLELVAEKYGDYGIKNLYRSNLRHVLEEVSRTVDRLPDSKIVITSDHGEFLGEEGDYGHCEYGYNHPVLREVPWLEVEE